MPLEDREVVREVWEARVPVVFSLAEEEVASLNPPEPFFLMLSRLQYLPLLTDKVRRHFSQYVNPVVSQNEVWVEHNGLPLKWQMPFGVIFDVLAPESLPFPLTVHFDGFPSGHLIPCGSKDVVRSHFMATLKEADALKHKGQVINGMQEKDHFALWAGLLNGTATLVVYTFASRAVQNLFNIDKFDQFWTANKALMTLDFKNIPVRVHTTKRVNLQRLVAPYKEDGKPTTLKDGLLQFFPCVEKLRIAIHGITPPLETPLLWMAVHFAYPDNFIHIVVTDKA